MERRARARSRSRGEAAGRRVEQGRQGRAGPPDLKGGLLEISAKRHGFGHERPQRSDGPTSGWRWRADRRVQASRGGGRKGRESRRAEQAGRLMQPEGDGAVD
jgi:hypothetical protein